MLRTASVATCLDKRLTVLGFEVPDLLAIFILLSVLHLFLGDLGNQLVLIWIPTVVFTNIIWIGKRGKPENYLIHWIRFHLKPGTLSAFDEARGWVPYPNTLNGTLKGASK
jgi:hypothetical protein